MRVEDAVNFSKRVGDVDFFQVGIAQRIRDAQIRGVSYEKASQRPPVRGNLLADLRSLGRFVVKVAGEM